MAGLLFLIILFLTFFCLINYVSHMQESSTIIDSADVKVVSKRTENSGEYSQSKYFLTF